MKRQFSLFGLLLALLVQPPAYAQLQFGPGPQATGKQLDSIVAVVDNDVITRRELNQALVEARHRMATRHLKPPPQQALEHQVLENLITKRLEQRAAAKRGIEIDDPSLNAAVQSIAQRNNLTLDQLRQAVKRQEGVSFAQFRDEIRQQLLEQRLRQQVVNSNLTVSKQEVDNALSRGLTGANGRQYHLAQILIAVPADAGQARLRQARIKARQVIAELRRGADFQRLAAAVSNGRRALQGGDLGWLSAAEMPPLLANAINKLKPGETSGLLRNAQGFHIIKLLQERDQSAKPVVQQRAREITIRTGKDTDDAAARSRLQRLRQRIINGASFAELAKANSMDAATASQGGEMGWLDPDQPDPQFTKQLDKLRPGQVSPPFKAAGGWHIVQLEERRQQATTNAAQRAAVRKALLQRKSDQEWNLWLQHLRDQAYIEIRL